MLEEHGARSAKSPAQHTPTHTLELVSLFFSTSWVLRLESKNDALCWYSKVVPSIASVRFLYEAISKEMGVGGLQRYRTQEHG